MHNSIKINTLLIYISIVLCIFSTSTLPGIQINITLLDILICFIGLPFLANIVNGISRKIFFMLIVWMLFLGFEAIYYSSEAAHCLRMGLMIFSFIFIFLKARKIGIDILKVFYQIFFILSLVSLIIYMCVEVAHIPIPYSIFYKDWTNIYKNYLYLYYSRYDVLIDSLIGITFMRNGGFFSEPGMYCVFLDICVLINLFYLNKRRKTDIIILIFTILTTSSTTGIIALLMILLYYYIIIKGNRSKGFFLIIGIMGVIALFFIIKQMLLTKSLVHASSYNSRLFDLKYGWDLFKDRPIFGWGFKNTEVFYLGQIGVFLGLRSNSNGVMTLLYQLGIVGAGIYIYPYINFICCQRLNQRLNKWLSSFIVIILMLLLSSQPFEYMALGFAILAYFITYEIHEEVLE